MDIGPMLTPSARQALREVFLERVSSLEPDLAGELTAMILDMEDEDILLTYLDYDAFQAQVQHCKAILLGSFTANPGEAANSDDELILTPTSSGRAAWSTDADPITQGDDEDLKMVVDAQEHKVEQRPEESAGTASDSDAIKHVVVESSTQSQHEPREVVETIWDPAKLNTMKEAVATSATASRQGTDIENSQDHESLSALASTSTVSYVLGGDRATVALASPASQEDVGKSAPEPPQSPRPETADQSHPTLETEAPASMPLMEAVRPAEAAARRVQSPQLRQRRSANTGALAQWTDSDCEKIVMLSFCCGFTVASCMLWCCGS